MSAQPKLKYTLEEYLELDRDSEARLEYWDGEVFDMSGSSPEHDQVESNLHFYLRTRLQGKPCRVFLANTRIKVPSQPPYRYGDMSSLGGSPQYEMIGGVKALTNPALIIEVLSKSTEGYDRGDNYSLQIHSPLSRVFASGAASSTRYPIGEAGRRVLEAAGIQRSGGGRAVGDAGL